MKFYYDICYLCHEVLGEDFEWDHVLPKFLGGEDGPEMPVHPWCNIEKRNHPILSTPEERRERHRESTRAGLERAKAAGKTLGRKPKITVKEIVQMHQMKEAGIKVEEIAFTFDCARSTVFRYLSFK